MDIIYPTGSLLVAHAKAVNTRQPQRFTTFSNQPLTITFTMIGSDEGIVVLPNAFAMIAMHARTYPTAQVHGLLVGSSQGGKIHISDAFPVCHETPTRPLVELALAASLSTIEACTDASKIVGWYTIPELVGEEKPGAGALRIVACLEAVADKPILLTFSKIRLEDHTQYRGGVRAETLKVFGKDFGMQWQAKLPALVSIDDDAMKALLALVEDVRICDLVDHWLSPLSSEWPSTSGIQQKIKKCLN